MISQLFILFLVFIKIGFIGFGGGYAMLSLIISELDRLNISLLQFADINALDMVIPGPIMINAATYVGYIHSGFWGSLVATLSVSVPSFILVTLVMHFIERYRENHLLNDILFGIKPAAVGLIAAAAMSIATAVIFPEGSIELFFSSAITFEAILPAFIFIITAILNIKYKINPILLTIIAGITGAFLLQ